MTREALMLGLLLSLRCFPMFCLIYCERTRGCWIGPSGKMRVRGKDCRLRRKSSSLGSRKQLNDIGCKVLLVPKERTTFWFGSYLHLATGRLRFPKLRQNMAIFDTSRKGAMKWKLE